MILVIVLAMLILALLRVLGEIVYERAFPKRTLPLFLVFAMVTLFALTNL